MTGPEPGNPPGGPPRTFHLGDVLSVTTGRLVSPGGIAGVHSLLDYMTGDSLFTHQFPRACGECAPELLRQYPALAEIETPEFDGEEHVRRWLAEQTAQHGTEIAVAPLQPGDHTHINPIAEFAMSFPDKPVIVIDASP